MGTMDPYISAESSLLVAGRYEPLRPLGRGGAGEVERAFDHLEQREVALKRFHQESGAAALRVNREVAALRLLDLPGVVRILDDGHSHGRRFVVMELIEGSPFPGEGRRSWSAIEAPARSLLGTLQRVHELGLVHRDIKPGNVLVTADGQTVLLDFGLARPVQSGDTVTRQGGLVGTPRYLAPEQLLGQRAGPKADLYAVGVMLYEALAGVDPYGGVDAQGALWSAKLTGRPIPLRTHLPDLPEDAEALVMSLLSAKPEERPASAVLALARLGDPAAFDEVPFLGDRAPLQALVEAALAGRSMAVVGPAGSGRGHLLRQAARELEQAGRRPLWCQPGQRPLESLGRFLDAAGPTAARRELQALLAQGGVLLVEEESTLDRWSRALLDELSPVLACREAHAPGRTHLCRAPLGEDELRGLFHGPERLLHLPSDGARELWRRSDGQPAAVATELRAWTSRRLARWEDGRLRIGREALDQIRVDVLPRVRSGGSSSADRLPAGQRELLRWVQLAGRHARPELLARALDQQPWRIELEVQVLVEEGFLQHDPDGLLRLRGGLESHSLSLGGEVPGHARLAALLEPGAPDRLFHLLAGGLAEELAEEALRVARAQREEGRLGAAEATLVAALRSLHEAGRAQDEARLMGPLLRTALAANSTRAIERARYELLRALRPQPALLAVAEAALAARGGDPERALRLSESAAGLDDPEAELARLHARMQAALRRPERAGLVIEELRARAERDGDEELRGLIPGWEGLLCFRQGRFQEAAALQEQSAALRTRGLGRLSASLNAAMSWLEAGELDRAEAMARRVLDEARHTRATSYEGRAEWLLRSLALCRREAQAVDEELLEAVQGLEDPELEAMVLSTEAMIALRAGELPRCAELAARAERAWEASGREVGVLHARAIRLAVDPAAEGERRALLARAIEIAPPMVALEVLALLAEGGESAEEDCVLAEKLAAAITTGLARGIFTADEATARVRARRRGP